MRNKNDDNNKLPYHLENDEEICPKKDDKVQVQDELDDSGIPWL